MPALNDEMAQKTANAESSGGGGALLPDGYYEAKLVEVKSSTSRAGNAMWVWTYHVGPDKKEMKEYTVLSDDALWKLRDTYEAFGAEVGSDTDDLIGRTVIAEVYSEDFTRKNGETGKSNKFTARFPDQSVKPRVFDAPDGDEVKALSDDQSDREADERDEPDF